jgi:hypothetical protein
MALITSAASGNFSAGATWTGGVVPTTGDEARASTGHTVTIDVNTTCDEISNAGTGIFTLADGVTLTANVTHKSTTVNRNLLQFTAASPAVGTIVGNILGATVSSTTVFGAVINTSTGALTITGNVTGGSSTIAIGANNASAGSITVTGNVTGGSASTAYGINNASTGTLNITGNCTGGSTSTTYGANNNSTGTLNITGNCTGGTGATAIGANNNSTGTMLVDGVIQASEFNAGVGGTNRSQVTLLTGPFLISPTFGVNPIGCLAWRWASALNNQTYLEVGTQTLLQKRNLVTPDNATNFPAASDVRSGTAYGIGGVVSGTCIVPNPAQVAAGTPVDNTVGTLAAASAADIATAVRSELSVELGRLDASISSRLAPSGTLATVTTLTNAPTVPTAAAIATQVRTELSSELAKVAALNTTRLGQVTTTEILGNLLAQANS